MTFWPKRINTAPIAETPVCEKCKLYKTCNNPYFKIEGEGNKGILFIAENPNKGEDLSGIISNSMLTEALDLLKIDIEKDCWYTYAVLCHSNEKIKDVQIKLCSEKLHKTIKRLKPKKIIPFGKLAIKSLIMGRLSMNDFSKWVGQKIPDFAFNSWIYPNHSSSFVGMNAKDPVVFDIWFDTLQQALEHNELKEFINFDNIIYITESNEAKTVLSDIINTAKEIAFDFETTGIKPHAEGHKIVYVSISDRNDRVFTMPFFNEDKEFVDLFKLLMESDIGKIAHNIKYETMWCLNKLGINVNNWVWDTMVASHCLNNLTGVSGLKFQSYVNYGLAGYEKEISKYISSDKDLYGSNGLNRMEMAPKKIALKYCGIDSLLLKRLKEKQFNEMTPFLKTGYDFFHRSLPVLSKMENTGIHVDEKYFKRKDIELIEEIRTIEDSLINSELGNLWKSKNRNTINPSSGDNISKLLFNICELTPPKITDKGNPSVDDSVIQELSVLLDKDDSNKDIVYFLDTLSEYRKLTKVHSTYIHGMLKEIVNGKIYPLVNLNLVASFRSSMDSPNLQNVPKRNKKIKMLVRGGFKPTKGNLFLEVDFSNLEVRGGCCYHLDPTMINYILNPHNDMHRDCAGDLFILQENDIHKDIRQETKGGFVFAETYGSFYKGIAPSLWKSVKGLVTNSGVPLRKHLASKGLRNLDLFTEHVRKVENIFWNKRFPIYKQWREDQLEYYRHNGFIKLKTGFICKGPLSRTQIFNMSIQGSSFHILLWCLSEIDREFVNRKLKSKIVIQIHDAILFDVCPPELEEVKKIARDVMTKKVREAWDWIIVPLAVEFEQSEIDGNWAEMH